MATARTTRSSVSSSPSTRAKSREKREGSSEKRPRAPRAKHPARCATPRARSAAAITRAIAHIKYKLLDGGHCHEIIDDFFDEVTCEPAFTFEFRGGPHWLHDAIARSCEEIAGAPYGHSTVYLTTVPEHALVHGSVTVGGFVGTAIYFDDLRLGVVGLFPIDGLGGSVYLRLVIKEVPKDPRDAPN